MKISFASPSIPRSGSVAVPVLEGAVLTPAGERLDAACNGAIMRAVKSGRFTGKRNQVLVLPGLAGLHVNRVVLIGIGKADAFDARAAEAIGGQVVAALGATGEKEAVITLDALAGAKLSAGEIAAHAGVGALLRSYRFDKYRTRQKPEDKPALASVTVQLAEVAEARRRFAPLAKVADGVVMTRDLVSEPANVIFPASLADRARTLTRLGVKVEVLDKAQMKKLGMGALLGVAQGSAHDPRLVVMRWNGVAAGSARAKGKAAARPGPVAFVGKGVTFDSGGISIKPSAGMEDMKWDMGGAAVVIGLMAALAGRKAKVDAVGIVGLVENMPSATAQRPGDVVTTMSGQTVEVINTDAEGRLVLADALWYCQNRFKPRAVIDLATLTGAIIVSLGSVRAGMFANDDALADQLFKVGEATGELLWRMPLGEAYDRDIDSDIADIKNIGAGRGAGSITAAQFLQRFIQKDVPWAHLDIAGVTWSKKDTPTVPKGGTAFGVRLLDRFVAEHCEG